MVAIRAYKGISPVVATVLLVAVAITIGIMVTTWVTQLVTKQTDPSSLCALNTNYIINYARFNFAGDNQLVVKLTNKGIDGIYGLGFIVENDTRILQFNSSHVNITVSPSVSSTNKLGQEQSVLASLNLNASDLPTFGRTLTKIRVTNDACKAISAETSSITKYPTA